MSTEPAPSLRPPDPNLPGIDQLTDIVAKLRGPGGCPWDREQTHASLRSALLEEAHEVVAAIDNRDDANLRELLTRAKREQQPVATMPPFSAETWNVTPLEGSFALIGRDGARPTAAQVTAINRILQKQKVTSR